MIFPSGFKDVILLCIPLFYFCTFSFVQSHLFIVNFFPTIPAVLIFTFKNYKNIYLQLD